MELIITTQGQAHCVYSEVIDLQAMGSLTIHRASHVEPDEQGRWWVDLSPLGGPQLGPFDLRSTALRAEVGWLDEHPALLTRT